MGDNFEQAEHFKEFLLNDKCRTFSFSPQLTSDIYELIAHICAKLNLSAEIEFTCFRNVDDFFQIYLEKLEVLIDKSPTRTKEKSWEQALTVVEKHTLAFILSIILICAKYVSNAISLPIITFLELLGISGRQCDLNYFQRLEFEIFELIDFKIQQPIAYYSALYFLELCKGQIAIDHKDVSSICEDLLRLSILKRQEIFESIDPEVITDMETYRSDQTLLGVAVLLTSFVVLKYPTEKVSQILYFLSESGNVSYKHVLFLSTRIKSVIHKAENNILINAIDNENIL